MNFFPIGLGLLCGQILYLFHVTGKTTAITLNRKTIKRLNPHIPQWEMLCPWLGRAALTAWHKKGRVQAWAVASTPYPMAMVTDFDDRLILPEIPHNCCATGVSRRQNVLDLPVPRQCPDVF